MNRHTKHIVPSAVDLNIEQVRNSFRTIIYELGETGHRSEYLAFLMKYISKNPELHDKYTFILNEKIKVKMGSLIYSRAYDIKYIKLTNRYSNSIRRSIYEWKQFEKQLCNDSNFTRIIFLDIDPYLFLLTTDLFKRHNFVVEGILFEPYYHYKEINRGAWFYVRHTLKSYVLQKCATHFNSKLEKLYILNDKKCIPAMNASIKNVFSFLPDPIDEEERLIKPDVVEQIRATYSMHSNKKNLLVFGSIDYRKNLINIIKSLLLLPDHVKQEIHLIIAGKFQKETKEIYMECINNSLGKLSICSQDRFVENEEKEVLFRFSDIVLMPYINFYSSSGILGHAIKYQKNVIVSKEGLAKRIVTENRIGLAVNPLNPYSIRDAVNLMLSNRSEFSYDNKMLMQGYNIDLFCKTLLSMSTGMALAK